jgi:hypothetical protein
VAAVATPIVKTIAKAGADATAQCVCGRPIHLHPGTSGWVHHDGQISCPTNTPTN